MMNTTQELLKLLDAIIYDVNLYEQTGELDLAYDGTIYGPFSAELKDEIIKFYSSTRTPNPYPRKH